MNTEIPEAFTRKQVITEYNMEKEKREVLKQEMRFLSRFLPAVLIVLSVVGLIVWAVISN